MALCCFKRLCCNPVVTKQKGWCITIDGQGTPVVTCMDACSLMHNSKAELVGHRPCCKRGLCSEARHKNPGCRAERRRCAQLADIWADLSVAFKLQKEELWRRFKRKSCFLQLPTVYQRLQRNTLGLVGDCQGQWRRDGTSISAVNDVTIIEPSCPCAGKGCGAKFL